MISKTELESVEFLKTIHCADDFSLSIVSSPRNPKENSLVLIQKKSYLNDLQKVGELENFNLSILVDELFWKSELIDNFDFVGKLQGVFVTDKFDQTMCDLSRLVYSKKYEREKSQNIISESASISNSACLGKGVEIGENVIIMDNVVIMDHVKIAKGSVLYPNVTIYPFVKIGEDCRIHSQSVIGSDGFGYKFFNGKQNKVWQSGGVCIERDVEIGANTCIDTGTFYETHIGEGTKIDNQVQIGHNSIIGKHCILCGKSGTAGSVVLGDYVVLAGEAGVGPGCEVGARSIVAGGGKVSKSLPEDSTVAGYPAMNIRDWKRSIIKFQKLGSRD